MVSAWGGMTFLIPYVIFVVLISSTGVIEEMALGRATKGGPIKAFGDCVQMRTGKRKAGEAIGFIPVLGSLALAMGYTVVVGWIFKYTYLAFSGKLSAMGNDMSAIGGMFGSTASTFGNNMWLIIAMVVTAVIMALGIAGGIEKANKVMMPLLFIMFVGLGIYIFTLPGSSAGYKYIFTLNPKGLLDIKLWIYAFGQAFFSLSIAGNGTVIYGSYLSDKENVVSSARNVAVFDTIAALLAAFVIIPGMAAGGAELSSGGPGLLFIYLVNVFNGMPGGKIVGIVFYVCVLFAGMSSLVNLYEAPVATIQEKLKLNRVASVGIIAVAGCVVSLVIQGIVSGWMDAVSIYISQNLGAKKIDRLKKGYHAALVLDLCFAVIAFAVIETLHTQISSLFLGKDGTALAYQVSGDYMRWLGYFFIFMGIKMATDGVLRGLGIMRPFLIANMVNLAIRLSVALLCAPRFGIAFVWLAVPAGWLANFLVSYAALRRSWPTENAAAPQ